MGDNISSNRFSSFSNQNLVKSNLENLFKISSLSSWNDLRVRFSK